MRATKVNAVARATSRPVPPQDERRGVSLESWTMSNNEMQLPQRESCRKAPRPGHLHFNALRS